MFPSVGVLACQRAVPTGNIAKNSSILIQGLRCTDCLLAGVRGVYGRPGGGEGGTVRLQSQTQHDGKKHHPGVSQKKEQAARACDAVSSR